MLKQVEGLLAYRRGELKGKGSVWHIAYYPYGPKDKTILYGPAPEGAKMVKGKGSTDKSAKLIRGIQPTKPIFRNTGAVDDVILPTKERKGIIIRSVPDKISPRKNPPKYPVFKMAKTIDAGGGIEIDRSGRGHIKL